MFSDLSRVPNKEDLLKILDLDEKCFDIITALTLGGKEEYTLAELRKQLDEFGLSITYNPILEHLDHLESKKMVSSRYESKYRYIKLETEGLSHFLFNDFIQPFVKDYENALEDASELTIDQIYSKLEFYYCNRGFVTLYFKCVFILNPIGEKENLLIKYIEKLYDDTIDIYLDELKTRDTKDIILFLGKLGKIMNSNSLTKL